MKTTNAFKLMVLFVSTLFVGCSSDDSEGGVNGELTSITVSAEQPTISFGDSFTFIIEGNNGKNLTKESTILVDDTIIDGNIFSPTVTGTFTVTAQYQDMVSEAIEVTATSGSDLALTVNGSKIDVSENFVFNVEYGNEDITANSTIYFDNVVIQSNIVKTPEVGSHEVYATFENNSGIVVTSETLTLEVVDRTTFAQNVLIEDFNGTWCGNCPRVSYGLELIEEQTDKTVVVGIHRYQNATTSLPGYDPFTYDAEVLENLLNVSGYPTAQLNRLITWNFPEHLTVDQVLSYIGNDADLGLKINSTLEGSTLDIKVDVKFGTNYSSETLKLVVYVLEDGLIYDQVNSTDLYGGVPILSDFTHNNVLRESVTDILGDGIPSAETSAKNVYTKNFSIPVPTNVEDKNNLDIVAFVIDSNNMALNSRTEVVGEEQLF